MNTLASSVTESEVGLFVHILSVVVAFGPLFAFPIMHRLAEGGDARNLPYFYGAVTKILRYLVTPAMLLLLISGFYLLSQGPAGFGDPWVSSAMAILIALFALVGAALIPMSSKLIGLSETEAAKATGENFELSKDYKRAARQLRILSASTVLLALAAMFLMTTQPG